MAEHVIVNGCGDYWFYMRFDDIGTADVFVALCESIGLGAAYPNGGWINSNSTKDVIAKNTTLITDEMLTELEAAVEACGEDDFKASDLIGDFENEHGWDDEDDETDEDD